MYCARGPIGVGKRNLTKLPSCHVASTWLGDVTGHLQNPPTCHMAATWHLLSTGCHGVSPKASKLPHGSHMAATWVLRGIPQSFKTATGQSRGSHMASPKLPKYHVASTWQPRGIFHTRHVVVDRSSSDHSRRDPTVDKVVVVGARLPANVGQKGYAQTKCKHRSSSAPKRTTVKVKYYPS